MRHSPHIESRRETFPCNFAGLSNDAESVRGLWGVSPEEPFEHSVLNPIPVLERGSV